jgi:hypothetical protein
MNQERRQHNDDGPSVEEYLRMNERDKDIAVQRAVIRLQTRIQEILYLMENEMKTKVITRGKEVKKHEKD